MERVDHMLTKQVFGIGFTELTSLIARRRVSCSKWANGKHSIAKSFSHESGNIWFESMDHTWVGGTEWIVTADEHGANAVPVHNKFVDQAKALEPRLLSMVIPSRWFFGGRGLDEFRRSMLMDRRIRRLVDYPDSRQCFQGVNVAGGICYFLWDRDDEGDCTVDSYQLPNAPSEVVRQNQSLSILKKVMHVETGSESFSLPTDRRFDQQVSS
ncbi:MAG: Eco57I restriction-modification methylase domain-containing protein [Actinobacteria bacterium]|nr:Eco57I restriction-modification methylase domain-containing protein [Actinomycetota bacterium]